MTHSVDHGGNIHHLAALAGCPPEAILDFSANINPLGPPPLLQTALKEALSQLVHYPEPHAESATQALANYHGLPNSQVVIGNGSSELLFALPLALSCRRALIPTPCYIDYQRACRRAGMEIQTLPLTAEDHFNLDPDFLAPLLDKGDLVIIGQPNNPTGRLVDRAALLSLIRQRSDVLFLVDEAFAGFLTDYRSLANAAPNLIVLCSLTKLYAMPGLRLGYLVAAPEICGSLREQLVPWSVNSLAQAAIPILLDAEQHVIDSQHYVHQARETLCLKLAEFSQLTVFPGCVDYLLIRLETNEMTAEKLAKQLLAEAAIAIRVCHNYDGLDGRYFRIAVRTVEDNQRLLTALSKQLAKPASLPKKKTTTLKKQKTTPALMLQGTGSDVGKSVLAAAFCRIFTQDGFRCAPFKAQNMSLNSHVTRDGGEMGRAQVVQAQACRLDPDVRMNPVLLKPNSDVGSQVIVHGRSRGNMRVQEYIQYKPTLWHEIQAAYAQLAAENQVMILEGAGSPGEVNLKSHDLVNMRMAAEAKSPVLLVGNIDKGGVYASFIGHWAVMAAWEKNLLAGFLVNRFRGDQSLLADAHHFTQQHTGKPVCGVIPYLHHLNLPEEDSVSFKAGLYQTKKPSGPAVTICAIDLPHISNFTDLAPFLIEEDVWLQVVKSGDKLLEADAVIIPGSKNVLADLAYLKSSGLAAAIVNFANQGGEVIGICGGFQLLGTQICDPNGIEGAAGANAAALGLLSLQTTLAADKTLTLSQGTHLASGTPVRGYEIHHGRSEGHGRPLLTLETKNADPGLQDLKRQIWGTYLHGFFDSDPLRRWFINQLHTRKGNPTPSDQGACYDLEPALDRLADTVRQNVELEKIYQMIM